jgi:phosphohistidine phosphatase
MARHIRREGIQPALVLCSSAVRARETLALVLSALGDPDVWVEPELYGAGVGELLGRLRLLPRTVPSAMVVGHLPALQDVGLRLAGEGEQAALARLRARMPTAALVTLMLSKEGWDGLAWGSARLAGFVVPKELE